MNRLTISVISILIMLASITVQAQTKRALIIGLGQQEDPDWNKINGDKDIPYVEEILNGAGFKSITKLVNKQATKDSIASAFEQLVASCNTGDIVYVHYSGHGQQMTDLDNDEADGLDECWIPYDAYRKACDKDNGEKHLTDDEVNKYLNAVRDKVGDSGKILVVVDACHSGDSTRGFGDEDVVRGVEDIFEVIKAFLNINTDSEKEKVINPKAVPNAERWITISACQSNQMNSEMKNPVVGKLTYALYTEIKENPTGSNEEFFNRLKAFINKNSTNNIQRPVLSGEIKRYNITDILR
ncbi:MAG: caspase family protein [Prevotella sp.]|nr:caspase family protein [Prevotella sp.]